MSDIAKEIRELIREYMEAVRRLVEIYEKNPPIRPHIPDKPTVPAHSTEADDETFMEARAKVNDLDKRLKDLLAS